MLHSDSLGRTESPEENRKKKKKKRHQSPSYNESYPLHFSSLTLTSPPTNIRDIEGKIKVLIGLDGT